MRRNMRLFLPNASAQPFQASCGEVSDESFGDISCHFNQVLVSFPCYSKMRWKGINVP
jgi:hypothetical protein